MHTLNKLYTEFQNSKLFKVIWEPTTWISKVLFGDLGMHAVDFVNLSYKLNLEKTFEWSASPDMKWKDHNRLPHGNTGRDHQKRSLVSRGSPNFHLWQKFQPLRICKEWDMCSSEIKFTRVLVKVCICSVLLCTYSSVSMYMLNWKCLHAHITFSSVQMLN